MTRFLSPNKAQNEQRQTNAQMQVFATKAV